MIILDAYGRRDELERYLDYRDELSLGLAPIVIKSIYEALPDIISTGVSAVVVEQDITKALSVSDRVYCLQEGRVSLEGQADSLSRQDITHAYFGM